jgi:L1 cell adhesion molecule like protein
VPQIEVTFDIDANGIFSVSALDTSTGKTNKVTITNEKGRLSQEEIDRMVSQAEQYKTEDEANRLRIEAKNALEQYCYNIRNTLMEERVKDKLGVDDRANADERVKQILEWLERNTLAMKDEFEDKQKELESFIQPLFMKLYESGTPTTSGGRTPAAGGGGGGPSVEEVD